MSWRRSALRVLALLASLLLLAVAWFLVDTIDGYPYLLGAGAGVTVAYLLRRRAAARRPPPAPGGVLPWISPALCGSALGLFANAYLDPSPPRTYASTVLIPEEGGQAEGRLVLRGFRPGEPVLKLQAHSRVGAFLSRGEDVTVVVRAGLFGWDWIERIESVHPF